MPFPWTLYLITALLSMVWAATEVISAFETAPVRALFTWGAGLLMITNAIFACLALMIVLEIVPTAEDNLITAFVVSIGWQALVRSQINVVRPLPGTPRGQGLVVPLDEVYGRIQRFVRRSIDQSLARNRVKVLTQALELDTGVLKQQVQLMSYGLTAMDPEGVRQWIQKMESRQMPEDERKMLLASKLIEVSGVEGLRQLIESEVRRAKSQPEPKTPPAASPATEPEPEHALENGGTEKNRS